MIGKVAVASTTELDKVVLWHKRLGHVSNRSLNELFKQGLLGKDYVDHLEFFEQCVYYGEASRVKFETGVYRTKQTLDYVHSNLWGPTSVQSHCGSRYFLSIVDDFSRRLWVYILKNKSAAFERLKDWKVLIEKQTDRKVKRLRTNNGLEYCLNEFNKYCTQ